jgi:SAM-dependent methyltransferase
MRPRIALARFLIRLGKFIESLAIMVMWPDDLVEFGRQMYTRPHSVASWGRPDLVDRGLSPDETALLEHLPRKEGRLLLLEVGGGREAIPLARMGFDVTGVDFVPSMVEKARENAAQRGVKIEGLVQEISRLDVPAGSYDVVWLSAGMYSCVPTRKRRVAMLRRIRRALRPGGYFVCNFHWGTQYQHSPKVELARRLVATVTLGNLSYEKGDMLWHNVEFIHGFLSEEELKSEFEAGGFEVVHLHVSDRMARGGAVLRKAET